MKRYRTFLWYLVSTSCLKYSSKYLYILVSLFTFFIKKAELYSYNNIRVRRWMFWLRTSFYRLFLSENNASSGKRLQHALLILLYLQALPCCQWRTLILHCASQRSRDYGSRCTHRTAPATDFLICRWPHTWQTWQSNYNWVSVALFHKYNNHI